MSPALPAVLFVDDEPNVLEAMRRLMHGRYEASFAHDGAEGLQLLETARFDVIVSDMRMPHLDGNEFLRRARLKQPDAIRLVLSGQSDLEEAAAAINDGRIFRFLIKPASRPTLLAALDAAVQQKRLVDAEKELLEHTLTGSVEALTQCLAITNPRAFGRGARIRRIVAELAGALRLSRRWPLELAASLSQLSAIGLPTETAERVAAGEPLTPGEQVMLERSLAVPGQVLRQIPRLEPVLALLESLHGDRAPQARSLEEATLWVAMHLERCTARGESIDEIVSQLDREQAVPVVLLEAARELRGLLLGGAQRSVKVQALVPGMVLMEELRTVGGALLLSRGHEVSLALLTRLQNVAASTPIREPVLVTLPSE
jgi:CheY-like chemotaxis protein